jgi:hypothetical protein
MSDKLVSVPAKWIGEDTEYREGSKVYRVLVDV